MSRRRTVRLGDSEADQHTIVFKRGEMVEILCSRMGLSGNSEEKKHTRDE